MDEKVIADSQEMWTVMRRFRLVFSARLHTALERGEINLPQYNLMAILEVNPDAKMGTLAEKLNVTMGAITNLIDRLVAMGYVERLRDPSDRRLVKAHLTQSGRSVLSERVRSVVETLMPAMAGIDPAERRAFLDTAGRLLSQMETQPRVQVPSAQVS